MMVRFDRWLSALVFVVGFVLATSWGCEAPVFPDAGAGCTRDDECETGAICRARQCVLVPSLDGSTTDLTPDTTPDDTPEQAPEQIGVKEGECELGQTRACLRSPVRPLGRCRPGEQRCENGRWGGCLGEVLPQPETCNGVDDDCDGQIDNTPSSQQPLERTCQSACGEGKEYCYLGEWKRCDALLPQVETCNGKDDDCDGQIDNRLVAPLCSRQKGVCVGARQRCDGTKGWVDCRDADYSAHSKGQYEPNETSCDQIDNDCDGVIDPTPPCTCREGKRRDCYSGPPGTAGQGPCRAGSQLCVAGQWGACVGESLPQQETCDGKDDDCDGKVDNGVTRACRSLCGAGVETCSKGRWSSCSAASPQPETCNGKDDDCDGKVDNLPQTTTPLQTPCANPCGKGVSICRSGSWSPCSAPQPQKEICNSKDDDCDGKVDNLSGKADALTRACQNACGSGVEKCQQGQWQSCSAGQSTPESCNGKDDDCDGSIDEGCYKARTFSSLSGPGVLPAMGPKGSYAAVLTEGGKVHYVRLRDGSIRWTHTHNGPVAGIAMSRSPFTKVSGSMPVVAMFGWELKSTSMESSLWLYEQQETRKLWQQTRIAKSNIAGDLFIWPTDMSLFGLEPGLKATRRMQLTKNSRGDVYARSTWVLLKDLRARSCRPWRQAADASQLIVTCPGFPWLDATHKRLAKLPSLATQLGGLPSNPYLAQLSISTSSTKLRSILATTGTTLDVHFVTATINQKKATYLLSSRWLSGRNTTTPGAIGVSSGNPPRLLKLVATTAPTGLLARPIGVRGTSDGLAIVSLQHFEAKTPHAPKGGRIAILSMASLLAGKWVEVQSFPLTQTPMFVDISPSGKEAVIASPTLNTFSLTVLSR